MKKTTLFVVISLIVLSAFAFAINFTPNTVFNQQLISQINAYNAAHNLPWKAALNPAFKNKTLAELRVLDGYRKLPQKMEEKIVNAYKLRGLTTTNDMIVSYYTLFDPTTMDDSSLPADYDLRNVGGVTPVKDQAWHNTCWAFSTAETMESAMIKQLGKDYIATHYPFLGATPMLSTQYIAYHNVDWALVKYSDSWNIQDSNYDNGGNQFLSFYNATRYGLAPAADFPYNAYENTPWISWDPQTPDWREHLVKPTGALLLLGAAAEKNYFGVTYDQYINAIKTMIKDYGSVSVAFAVPADFYGYESGVYVPATPITYIGLHAVQIVGWKSNVTASNGVTYPTVWIVRNSWGTTWGENGFWEQPAVTEKEYESGKVPWWKFAALTFWFYVPIFTKPDSVNWQAADFNNDGVVNMTDYELLMNALNETNPSSSTIAKYDIGIPKDGRIDGNDVSEFMYLWNKAATAGH